MPLIQNNKLMVLVLESPLNFSNEPNAFNYHRFKKETNLWKANIVMYVLNEDGTLEKKIMYRNNNYDAVPMDYQSNGQKDFVLYLNNGKSEKFAILNLNQL
jgi:antitoxin component YwqK of YwqJK toxin-antitoxin module